MNEGNIQKINLHQRKWSQKPNYELLKMSENGGEIKISVTPSKVYTKIF